MAPADTSGGGPPPPPPAAGPSYQAGLASLAPSKPPQQGGIMNALAGILAPKPAPPQQQWEQKRNGFVKAAAQDFLSGNIGAEDLQKATTYHGDQDYDAWKNENVRRLKAAAKESGE